MIHVKLFVVVAYSMLVTFASRFVVLCMSDLYTSLLYVIAIFIFTSFL